MMALFLKNNVFLFLSALLVLLVTCRGQGQLKDDDMLLMLKNLVPLDFADNSFLNNKQEEKADEFSIMGAMNAVKKKINKQIAGKLSETVITNLLGSTPCRKGFLHAYYSKTEPWVGMMFDSWGKPAPGVLKGNTYWPGNYDECKRIKASYSKNGYGGFSGKYCNSKWHANLGGQEEDMTMAVCFPDTCSPKEIEEILNIMKMYLDSQISFKDFGINDLILKNVKCQRDIPPMGASGYGMVTIIWLLVAVVIGATGLDAYYKHVKSGLSQDEDNVKKGEEIENSRQGNFLSAILCFSMYRSSQSLWGSAGDSNILCVHGLRSLCAIWMIVSSSTLGARPFYANRVDFFDSIIYKASSYFAVRQDLPTDSLLLISGFLLAFYFFAKVNKPETMLSWALFYIKRYLRLTIPVLFTTLFFICVLPYLTEGPYWENFFQHSAECSETFIYNMFYLNNIVESSYQCGLWAWYLANEWQFFSISPIFLWGLLRKPKSTLFLMVVIVVSATICTGLISEANNLRTISDMDPNELTDISNEIEKEEYLILIKPYCRITAYLVGLALGFICQHFVAQERIIKLRWTVFLTAWTLSVAVLSFFGFSLYDHGQLSVSANSFWKAITAPCWSLALAWIIFSCVNYPGAFTNTFLSLEEWLIPSRLFLNTYLAFQVIFAYYCNSLQIPIYFSTCALLLLQSSMILYSYITGLILALLVERPIVSLGQLILAKLNLAEL